MERMSVMKKLMISYCVLIVGVMVLMGGYMLPVQLRHMDRSLDDSISWTARLVSEDSAVVEAVDSGIFPQELKERLDRLLGESQDIDYIVISDKDSIRLYHPDNSLIGQPFAGGDERGILAGVPPYVTTSRGSAQVQRRAFHSIQNDLHELTGFIMVSASLSTIRHEQRQVIFLFGVIFTVILILAILFARIISGSIRKSLLGFEPGTFARMYLQREEILDNLAEGIVAVDAGGGFLYRNTSAGRFLEEDHLPKGSPLSGYVEECRVTGLKRTGLMVETGNHTLLASVMPLVENSPSMGILLILRDRTEITQMAEQMTGMDHMVEALRANIHEYLNKLHVISGLLQIGEVPEAIKFIDGTAADTKSGYQAVIHQIENRTIAALLLGKSSHARELDIQFTLRKDSYLEPHNRFLSTKELVTIIGNLIENAFEAIAGKEGIRQVELFIGSEQKGLTLSVDDTGRGMTPEQVETIYQRQYTTKGEGHGIGLRLIQEIVRKHDGYLDIESEPGEGSSFTISISRERTIEKKVKEND